MKGQPNIDDSGKTVFKCFLLTDIVGSTQMWKRHEAAMARAVNSHDDIVAEVVARNKGHLVRTKGEGDSTFSAYDSAENALSAAAELVTRLGTESWPDGTSILVRTGVHAGEAVSRAGDYYGTTINKAARLRAIAHPGQVVVSRFAYELATGNSSSPLQWKELGIHQPRDFEPEPLYQLVVSGQPVDFPPLSASVTVPTNLSTPLRSFIGRQTELAELEDHVTQSRLVTLVGSGGTGKTRLLVEFARTHLESFPDGVYFLDLSSVSAERLVSSVLAILSLRQSTGQADEDILASHLASKSACLLFDNCEHVLEDVKRLVNFLVQQTKCQFLATSQRPLRVDGESVVTIKPFICPRFADDPSSVLNSDVVRLFIDRAKSAKPSFRPGPSETKAIVEICRTLDGVPYAVELAAAMVDSFSVSDIAQLVAEKIVTIESRNRDAPDRQRTLQAAVEWSHGLLPYQAQDLLCRLSVFEGGFAMSAVHALSLNNTNETVAAFASLCDMSLVNSEESVTGDLRYWLLQSVKKFGENQLAHSGTADQAIEAHAKHYLSTASEVTDSTVEEKGSPWKDWYRSEYENINKSLKTGLARGWSGLGVEAVASLTPVWRYFGELQTGRNWINQFRALLTERDEERLARLDAADGALAWQLGQLTEAKLVYRRAIATYEKRGECTAVAQTLNKLGLVYWQEHHLDLATDTFQLALATLSASDDLGQKGDIINNLGIIEWERKNLGTALDHYKTALDIRKQIGESSKVVQTMSNIALVYRDLDRLQEALEISEEALNRTRSAGYRIGMSYELHNLASLRRRLGDYELARDLNEEARQIFIEIGDKHAQAHAERLFGTLSLDQGQAGQAVDNFLASLRLSLAENYASVIKEALSGLVEALTSSSDYMWAAVFLEAHRTLQPDAAFSNEQVLRGHLGNTYSECQVRGSTTPLSQLLEDYRVSHIEISW